MSVPRYAVYYAPPADSPLARLGAAWLGRDADRACRVEQPAVDGLSRDRLKRLTAAPRRYGFHATLKAPFELAPCVAVEDLTWALGSLAAKLAPVTLPGLRLSRIARFLALTLEADCPELQALAASCVSSLDPFRAALSDADLLKRRSSGLSEAQMRLLQRWGYPYVMEAFRFHMTLTGKAPPSETETLTAFLETYFGPELGRPLIIDELSLFEQPSRHRPFRRIAVFPLKGRPAERALSQQDASNAA